jgi:gliding motility-associated-like protein
MYRGKAAFLVVMMIFCAVGLKAQSTFSITSIKKISNLSGNLGQVLGQNSQFGSKFENIGDLDGDGILDLAVGSIHDPAAGSQKGAVYILFMKADGSVKNSQRITEMQGNLQTTFANDEHFGSSVTCIGDLDGDGIQDLAVGAVGRNGFKGSVYILFMKRDGTVKNFVLLDGNSTNLKTMNTAGLGYDIVCPGDINGDGINDIAVGAFYDQDGGNNTGATIIMFLNTDGSAKSFQKISNSQGGFTAPLHPDDQFGIGEGRIGDIDHDGVPDIAVSCPNYNNGASGTVFLIRLNRNGTVKNYTVIDSKQLLLDPNELFGQDIALLPDIDGDGVNELLFGAEWNDDGGSQRGAAYILFLNASSGVKSFFKISNATSGFQNILKNGDNFGVGVSAMGALSPNNEVSIAVGTLGDDDKYGNSGAVYIITLSPPLYLDILEDSVKGCYNSAFTAHFRTNGNVSWKGGPGALSTFDDSIVYRPSSSELSKGHIWLHATATNSGQSITDSVELVFIKPALNAGKDTSFLCPPGDVPLHGTAKDILSASWSGGKGLFKNSSNLVTDYYPDQLDTGKVELYLTATTPCGTLKDTLRFFIAKSAVAYIAPDTLHVCRMANSVKVNYTTEGGPASWSGGHGKFSHQTVSSVIYEPDSSDANETTLYLEVNSACKVLRDSIVLDFSPDSIRSWTADSGCLGKDVIIHFTPGLDPASVQLKGGMGTYGVVDSNTVVYHSSPDDSMNTHLVLSGQGKCNAVQKDLLIHFVAKPVAIIDVPAYRVLVGKTLGFKNKSLNATRYLWDFGDGTTDSSVFLLHSFSKTGKYFVKLQAFNNFCEDDTTIEIEVLEDTALSTDIFIPNAFSPNDDSLNSVFLVICSTVPQEFEMQIYNRWGERLFLSKDIKEGWNGSTADGTACQEGAYFYIINATFSDSDKRQIKGTVTLLN